jgi:hypothetical protein
MSMGSQLLLEGLESHNNPKSEGTENAAKIVQSSIIVNYGN